MSVSTAFFIGIAVSSIIWAVAFFVNFRLNSLEIDQLNDIIDEKEQDRLKACRVKNRAVITAQTMYGDAKAMGYHGLSQEWDECWDWVKE